MDIVEHERRKAEIQATLKGKPIVDAAPTGDDPMDPWVHAQVPRNRLFEYWLVDLRIFTGLFFGCPQPPWGRARGPVDLNS